MENEEAKSIIGNASAPYINALIAQYGLATNYTAVAHPSEPNYIALFSGSTFGVTDDGTHNLPGKNLADQIEAKGRDWRVYEQNLPDAPCFTEGHGIGRARRQRRLRPEAQPGDHLHRHQRQLQPGAPRSRTSATSARPRPITS